MAVACKENRVANMARPSLRGIILLTIAIALVAGAFATCDDRPFRRLMNVSTRSPDENARPQSVTNGVTYLRIGRMGTMQIAQK
jgi:hypothetical protein